MELFPKTQEETDAELSADARRRLFGPTDGDTQADAENALKAKARRKLFG